MQMKKILILPTYSKRNATKELRRKGLLEREMSKVKRQREPKLVTNLSFDISRFTFDLCKSLHASWHEHIN